MTDCSSRAVPDWLLALAQDVHPLTAMAIMIPSREMVTKSSIMVNPLSRSWGAIADLPRADVRRASAPTASVIGASRVRLESPAQRAGEPDRTARSA